MSCCAATTTAPPPPLPSEPAEADRKPVALRLSVPGIHCAGCIARIEEGLAGIEGVARARVNVSRKQVTIEGSGDERTLRDGALVALRGLGFETHETARETDEPVVDPQGRILLRSLGIAGFAAMNVMLLSVSVWAGAEGTTRDLLHWISALIALPAALIAGRPFFESAWAGLRAGALVMDVPISLAIVLACALSLHETATGGEHAYFDAALTLIFFLLAGRTLDHFTRRRMRASLSDLAKLLPNEAERVEGDGVRTVALDVLGPGDVIRVASGARVPVDAVATRATMLDHSHATGESDPVRVASGEPIVAGSLLIGPAQDVTVASEAQDSFVSRMSELMERAEGSRPSWLRFADQAARIYTPLVHIIAFAAFAGWLVAGASVHQALTVAVATLIITCPCALGLAVPAVQTVAVDLLGRMGIVLRDGAALERLTQVRAAVFDKTGTLTRPRVGARLDDETLRHAAALASHSTHPLSRALVEEAHRRDLRLVPITDVREVAGEGLTGRLADGRSITLGADTEAGLTIAFADRLPVPVETHHFVDPEARAAIEALPARLGERLLLSGDREDHVREVAGQLGLSHMARATPARKVRTIEGLRRRHGPVLMVGDGLNDAAALRAADVSAAPARASDLTRNAADLVLLGGLRGLGGAFVVADIARRHVMQNFAVAALYNAVAVPLAVSGLVTPLHAAIAMSTSSIIVVANALRLRPSVRRALRRTEPRAERQNAIPTSPQAVPA